MYDNLQFDVSFWMFILAFEEQIFLYGQILEEVFFIYFILPIDCNMYPDMVSDLVAFIIDSTWESHNCK